MDTTPYGSTPADRRSSLVRRSTPRRSQGAGGSSASGARPSFPRPQTEGLPPWSTDLDERAQIEKSSAGARSWSCEAAARQLFARVRDAGSRGHDLPTRLAAGLGAALDLLAREPDLARLLTVDSHDAGEDQTTALDARRRWVRHFARLLEDAAAADPRCSPAAALREPFLIAGVRSQVARIICAEEASELPRLLPSLLEVLLAYYFEPGESHRLARAVLDG